MKIRLGGLRPVLDRPRVILSLREKIMIIEGEILIFSGFRYFVEIMTRAAPTDIEKTRLGHNSVDL